MLSFLSVGYLSCASTYNKMSLSTDQKLDALLASVDSFKDSQMKSQQTLEEKLQKFDAELESTKDSQEEATERALTRIKRDRPIQFQRKGHEEQYRFNADIRDHVAAASRQLEKLAPPEKEKPIVEKAIRELNEGASSLAERQKHIRFADQAENSWDAVAEYIGYSFADDEEDDRKLDSSDRSAGEKKRRKAATGPLKAKRFPGHKEYPQRRHEEYGPPQRYHQEYPEFQGYSQPNNFRMMPYHRQQRLCYQCGLPGHIRANCPNQRPPAKQYPLNHSCVDGVKDCMTHVCVSGSQRDVNTVSVRPGGHCNGLSSLGGVVSTNCVNEFDQGLDKIIFENIVDGSPKSDPPSQEGREWDPLLSRCWEVEEGTGQIQDVQGRLKSCLSFWEKELDPAP